MKLAHIDPSSALYIDQILDTLRLNEVKVIEPVIHATAATLEHKLSVDEFDNLVMTLMVHHGLQPQNPDWFPGTPTGDPEDFGYYICPITNEDWDEGQFDMVIMYDSIDWT